MTPDNQENVTSFMASSLRAGWNVSPDDARAFLRDAACFVDYSKGERHPMKCVCANPRA